MPYIIVLIALSFGALYAVKQDNLPNQPQRTIETVTVYAEHFSLYRGWVQRYVQQQENLPVGAIADTALFVPEGLTYPAFDHHAQHGDDGNIYVWSTMAGSFYAASAAIVDSASLCHVIQSRQCISGGDTQAILAATNTPDFIPTGSTVYVWQR